MAHISVRTETAGTGAYGCGVVRAETAYHALMHHRRIAFEDTSTAHHEDGIPDEARIPPREVDSHVPECMSRHWNEEDGFVACMDAELLRCIERYCYIDSWNTVFVVFRAVYCTLDATCLQRLFHLQVPACVVVMMMRV